MARTDSMARLCRRLLFALGVASASRSKVLPDVPTLQSAPAAASANGKLAPHKQAAGRMVHTQRIMST